MRTFRQCLEDPEEQPFFVRMLNEDAQALADYTTWLVARNDPRGELLQIGVRLAAGVADEAERKQLLSRFHELRADLDEHLQKLLLERVSVCNCGEQSAEPMAFRFSFRCPQLFTDMRPTDEANVRFCDRCATPVVHCSTLAEAERHARLGACISVPARVIGEADSQYVNHHVTGRPDVFASWARHLFPSD